MPWEIDDALGKYGRRIAEVGVATGDYDWVSAFAHRHQAIGEERGAAQGRRDGVVELVRQLLELRGIRLTSQQHERIDRCTDATTLIEWHRRAVTATSADEVFAE